MVQITYPTPVEMAVMGLLRPFQVLVFIILAAVVAGRLFPVQPDSVVLVVEVMALQDQEVLALLLRVYQTAAEVAAVKVMAQIHLQEALAAPA
jgi:hypothetical protein